MKFQKTETLLCRWKSNDYNDINILLSLENPCTFLLTIETTQKRIFNANCELLQNRTEKQIMPFIRTVNWLFNDTCYLVIGCFDWNIGIFQWSVVKVYYILNRAVEKGELPAKIFFHIKWENMKFFHVNNMWDFICWTRHQWQKVDSFFWNYCFSSKMSYHSYLQRVCQFLY